MKQAIEAFKRIRSGQTQGKYYAIKIYPKQGNTYEAEYQFDTAPEAQAMIRDIGTF